MSSMATEKVQTKGEDSFEVLTWSTNTRDVRGKGGNMMGGEY